MIRIIISIFLILTYGYSGCDTISKLSDINDNSCKKATECLKKESTQLRKDLSELKEISLDLDKELTKSIDEYARCDVYARLAKQKPKVKRWEDLANRCSNFYLDFSKKLAKLKLNLDALSKDRKQDTIDTLEAVEADLKFVKQKCNIK